MQKLAQAVDVMTDTEDERVLNEAAIKWARHCLTTYRGKRLKRGLEISRVLSEFVGLCQRQAS